MIFSSVVLPGVLLPAAAALVVLAIVSLVQRPGSSAPRPLGGALPLGAAFATGFVALAGWPRWLPNEATQRLFYLVLIAALLAPLWDQVLGKTRLAVTLAYVVLVLVLLLEAQIEYRWTRVSTTVWLLVFAVLATGFIWAWQRSTMRPHLLSDGELAGSRPQLRERTRQAPAVPSPWWTVALLPTLLGSFALCLGLSGSALLGQLMGALAVASAVIEIWQRASGRPVWAPRDGVTWAVSVGGLLLLCTYYAELEVLPVLLMSASLLLLMLHRPSASSVMRLGVLVPALIATGLVVAAELEATDDADPYDYGSLIEPVTDWRERQQWLEGQSLEGQSLQRQSLQREWLGERWLGERGLA